MGGVPVNGQADLFGGEAHARRSDPATSHHAAKRVNLGNLRESQKEVLALLGRTGPVTDETLVEKAREEGVRQSPSGLRSRRAELVDKGLAEDSQERQETMFGNPATVWRLTKKGRFLARDLNRGE